MKYIVYKKYITSTINYVSKIKNKISEQRYVCIIIICIWIAKTQLNFKSITEREKDVSNPFTSCLCVSHTPHMHTW